MKNDPRGSHTGSAKKGNLRSGLAVIDSFSRRTLEAILRFRPFASLEDLVARARPREAEAEHLIRSGALDFTGLPRNHLLWKLMTAYRDMGEPVWMCCEGGLGFEVSGPAPVRLVPVPDLPGQDPADQWKEEWQIMGYTCGDHPIRAFRADLARAGAKMSTAIPRSMGRPIRLGGIIAAQRRTRTDKGELMQFLTLDDEAGIFEVVLFPDVYQRTRFVLDGPGPYIVDGRPEDNYGAVAINAWNLEALG